MENKLVDEVEDELEGLDKELSSHGWGKDYSLDAVFVRSVERTVGDIVSRIQKGRYQLNPDFQRDFLWDKTKQSRLIESCLMRIPLPVLYVAEAKDGKIIVVDGLQRLTTFLRYIQNQFALVGLGENSELSGKKFQDLPIRLQERIEDTPLTLYILDSNAPEQARLDIFERVNGGVPLTRQQMRNCLYNGKATQWLKDLSESDIFLKATGESLDRKSMRDREVINRFCAFYLLGFEEYQGDMDAFLGEALETMNHCSDEQLQVMRDNFETALEVNYLLFGEHAFRKSLRGDSKRTVINVSLFDVCTVILSSYGHDDLIFHKKRLSEAIQSLLLNGYNSFEHAITYSTNSTSSVRKRFSLAAQAISEVME